VSVVFDAVGRGVKAIGDTLEASVKTTVGVVEQGTQPLVATVREIYEEKLAAFAGGEGLPHSPTLSPVCFTCVRRCAESETALRLPNDTCRIRVTHA
jgi:hypothetical protein